MKQECRCQIAHTEREGMRTGENYIIFCSLHDAAGEMLKSLKEMREACAACFRVIANAKRAGELGTQLHRCNIRPGFGNRADAIIKKAERKEGHHEKPIGE